jgi:hypothetical protein
MGSKEVKGKGKNKQSSRKLKKQRNKQKNFKAINRERKYTNQL